MMRTLSLDMETYSEVDIKLGLHAYFSCPKARLLCMAWAFDDDAPSLWWAPDAHPLMRRPRPFPAGIIGHVKAGGSCRSWNFYFEWMAWHSVLAKVVPDLPPLSLEQARCTQAEALAMGFPYALGKCGAAMGLAEMLVKDPRGAQLMRICSMPNKRGIVPTRDDWLEYGGYCKQDVISERAIAGRLRRLPAVEREVWRATARMNDRGLKVDVELAASVAGLLEPATQRADRELARLTGGAVTRATQRARTLAWLQGSGLPLTGLRKRGVADVLAGALGPLTAPQRRVLELRRGFALSSPRKLGRLLSSVRNGVLHDQLMYHGAHTGRWSSVGVQLQNMLRPPPGFDAATTAGMFRDGCLPPDPMRAAGALLRHMFVARDGCSLLIGDYRQVEARGVAWLGGQDDLLQALAEGRPIYEDVASTIFAKKVGKDDPERQIGKITILGCGYQLGPYGLLLQLPPGSTLELAEHCVHAYRSEFPEIPKLWRRCEGTLVTAVKTGHPQTIGRGVWFGLDRTAAGPFLFIQLPSGRRLYYFEPSVETDPEYGGEKVVFWGRGRAGAAWGKRHFYGGYIVENIVQGLCRDLLAGAMLRVGRTRGWHNYLTVHDEVVAEVPDRLALDGGEQAFRGMLEHAPKWAAAFPLEAEIHTAKRYGKRAG
jgi:DNA polymerase